jgi:hypothetical protein
MKAARLFIHTHVFYGIGVHDFLTNEVFAVKHRRLNGWKIVSTGKMARYINKNLVAICNVKRSEFEIATYVNRYLIN